MAPLLPQSLVESLTDPRAYPHPVEHVEVEQTHTSIVFLTDELVYKLKKPVQLGFLDYSTLEKRSYYCRQEVTLNRRLAPEVYLGVVPVTADREGLRIDGSGQVREWAVKMRRLPDEATLESRVRDQTITARQIRPVAEKLARFHEEARSGRDISRYGRFEIVERNVMENFTQTSDHVGDTVSKVVFERVRERTRQTLDTSHSLIDHRADADIPRDTHGDLRLEHVYLLPPGEDPERILIVDCVEFNDRFRYADPVADIAFLLMDLRVVGRRDLASTVADTYFAQRSDSEGRNLLPLYTSYRSLVRAKVLGIRARQEETPRDDRLASVQQAKAHWLLALDTLAPPDRRPCLLLIGGLPGTGKSTVARKLAEEANFDILSTDNIRRELTGRATASNDTGELYDEASKEAVYRECLERAAAALWEGRRIIVDATFHKQERRMLFLGRANQLGIRSLFLICEANPSVVRQRLANRTNSISDADQDVYEILADEWEPVDGRSKELTRTVSTDRELQRTLTTTLDLLREVGMYG